MKDYEHLLNKAMEKMPKKVEHKERFEIPKVVAEVHGSKTIVRNFGDLLTALRRDDHLSKFFFKELATAGSVQGNTLVLQGKFFQQILQKKLEGYIKEFVYCKECGEPDTKLVKEDKIVFAVCEACGAKHPTRHM